jgi:hypothetical protein
METRPIRQPRRQVQRTLALRGNLQQQRRQYALALAKELVQFERPMPVMDEYDLLLTDKRRDIQ